MNMLKNKISSRNFCASSENAEPATKTYQEKIRRGAVKRLQPKHKNCSRKNVFQHVLMRKKIKKAEDKCNNYAFVDSQNLNLSIRSLGWRLDYRRFRKYLQEKYGVAKAYLFIGYVEGNNTLYSALQEAGFICIFKPTLQYKDGTTKGNCDAELVLQAMIEYQNYHKAIIVTGDGDFYCLINYLIEKDKLEAVLIPNGMQFSALLKLKLFRPYLKYMNELKTKLAYTKKRPRKD